MNSGFVAFTKFKHLLYSYQAFVTMECKLEILLHILVDFFFYFWDHFKISIAKFWKEKLITDIYTSIYQSLSSNDGISMLLYWNIEMKFLSSLKITFQNMMLVLFSKIIN